MIQSRLEPEVLRLGAPRRLGASPESALSCWVIPPGLIRQHLPTGRQSKLGAPCGEQNPNHHQDEKPVKVDGVGNLGKNVQSPLGSPPGEK